MTEIIIAILLQIMTIVGDKPSDTEEKGESKDKGKIENPIKKSGGGADWKEGE